MIEHVPVMPEEVMAALALQESGTYVDCTLGLGGHAERILSVLGPAGRLVGMDRDEDALARTRERLGRDPRVVMEHANFGSLPEVLRRHGIEAADGILFDLGISMAQLTDDSRGFSFQSSAPLDMRMDRSRGSTAADLVNGISERELADIIFAYGEERRSRRIARAIMRARPVMTCADLARIIEGVMPRRGSRIHPATRTFQALRIAVNEELDILPDALAGAARSLRGGGRLCVIAYHSLEDRIVKEKFRELQKGGFALVTKKPLRPTEQEVARNRASRSARLRILVRDTNDGSREETAA